MVDLVKTSARSYKTECPIFPDPNRGIVTGLLRTICYQQDAIIRCPHSATIQVLSNGLYATVVGKI
jgi:hypothetical protein